MIDFKCSECGMQLRVASEAAGKRGKCTQCGAVIVVPEAELVKLEAADSTTVPPRHRSASKPRASTNAKRRKHRIWMLLLVLSAVIATPFAPKFPLWLGIVLLALCVFAFLPRVKRVSHHLLKLNPTEMWRTSFRVTAYFVIGLVLIFAGKIGADYKAEQQQIAIKKAAEEAEHRVLVNEANAQLTTLVAEAETVWKAGNSVAAGEMLEIAIKTPDATNLSLVRNLRSQIANENVEALIAEAIKALNDNDIDNATVQVAAAIAVPYASTMAEARKLDKQIRNATDPERTQSLLMKLSDKEFQQLKDDGIVPAHFISGYEVLDRSAVELANKQLQQIASARKERRQAQLVAEQKRQEEVRLAAESAHKAEQERQTQQFIPTESRWYVGGTLHGANMGEWYKASSSNRLATCADFVTSMMKQQGQSPKDMENLRELALDLEICVSEAGDDTRLHGQGVAGIAAACWILMGH